MKYVTFLRGINVGGNTKVEMIKLKKSFEELGFENVKTLLNSGNVVFETSEKDSNLLVQNIEDKLATTFGFPIKVFVRLIDQLDTIIALDPFKKVKINKDIRLYVTLLFDKEIYNVVDLTSKGTVDLMKELDKKYGKSMTTRNWNTIMKIVKL